MLIKRAIMALRHCIWLATGGHLAVVKALLAQGADVNQAINNDVNTPLFIACQEGHFDIAELLLKKNAESMHLKQPKNL